MKVIDLLNKIAKGEEVPKKIKHHWEYEYKFDELRNEYCYMNNKNERFDADWLIISMINDKVEIIEDKPKHIEELANVWGKEGNLSVDAGVNLMDKINELSKAVNYLLDKEGK
jgi:hypothetical protein